MKFNETTVVSIALTVSCSVFSAPAEGAVYQSKPTDAPKGKILRCPSPWDVTQKVYERKNWREKTALQFLNELIKKRGGKKIIITERHPNRKTATYYKVIWGKNIQYCQLFIIL